MFVLELFLEANFTPMPYLLEYRENENLIWLKASGFIDITVLKQATLDLQSLVLKHSILNRRVWNDTRGCEVQLSLEEFDEFVSFHEQKLVEDIEVKSAKAAFLVDQPLMTAFATTFRNRMVKENINREIFTTEEAAKAWLFSF
jgi:hypothetical protein